MLFSPKFPSSSGTLCLLILRHLENPPHFLPPNQVSLYEAWSGTDCMRKGPQRKTVSFRSWIILPVFSYQHLNHFSFCDFRLLKIRLDPWTRKIVWNRRSFFCFYARSCLFEVTAETPCKSWLTFYCISVPTLDGLTGSQACAEP